AHGTSGVASTMRFTQSTDARVAASNAAALSGLPVVSLFSSRWYNSPGLLPSGYQPVRTLIRSRSAFETSNQIGVPIADALLAGVVRGPPPDATRLSQFECA